MALVRGVLEEAVLEADDQLTMVGINVSTSDYAAGMVDAILAAIDTAGYCVVPKEATDEMVEAAYDVEVLGADLFDFVAHDCAPPIWQAMIAKATEPNQ